MATVFFEWKGFSCNYLHVLLRGAENNNEQYFANSWQQLGDNI